MEGKDLFLKLVVVEFFAETMLANILAAMPSQMADQFIEQSRSSMDMDVLCTMLKMQGGTDTAPLDQTQDISTAFAEFLDKCAARASDVRQSGRHSRHRLQTN